MTIDYPITPWKAANRCIGDARARIQILKDAKTGKPSTSNEIHDLIELEETNVSFFKGIMEGLLRKDGRDIEGYRIQAETLFGRRQWFAIGVLEGASSKW